MLKPFGRYVARFYDETNTRTASGVPGMWIVKVALGRPYTFIVLALLLLILGPLSIVNTAKDIFPNIGIPVVSVIWTYSGLPPEEMSGRITGGFERVSLVA